MDRALQLKAEILLWIDFTTYQYLNKLSVPSLSLNSGHWGLPTQKPLIPYYFLHPNRTHYCSVSIPPSHGHVLQGKLTSSTAARGEPKFCEFFAIANNYSFLTFSVLTPNSRAVSLHTLNSASTSHALPLDLHHYSSNPSCSPHSEENYENTFLTLLPSPISLRPDSSTILTQPTSCMSSLGATLRSHTTSPNLLGFAFTQDGPLLACYSPLVLHQFKSRLYLWCANYFQISPSTLHWPFSWKWSVRFIHNISCINSLAFIIYCIFLPSQLHKFCLSNKWWTLWGPN